MQDITIPPVLHKAPCSLATEAGEDREEELSRVAGGSSLMRRLLGLLGYNSSEAVGIRAATGLYDALCAQVDRSPLHDLVQLPASFYSRWCAASTHGQRCT